MIVESYVCPSLICLSIWVFAFHKTFNSSLIYFFEISGKRTPNQKRHPKVAKNDFSDDEKGHLIKGATTKWSKFQNDFS